MLLHLADLGKSSSLRTTPLVYNTIAVKFRRWSTNPIDTRSLLGVFNTASMAMHLGRGDWSLLLFIISWFELSKQFGKKGVKKINSYRGANKTLGINQRL